MHNELGMCQDELSGWHPLSGLCVDWRSASEIADDHEKEPKPAMGTCRYVPSPHKFHGLCTDWTPVESQSTTKEETTMKVEATYKAPENPKGTVTLVMDEDSAKELQRVLYDVVVGPTSTASNASKTVASKVEQELYEAISKGAK